MVIQDLPNDVSKGKAAFSQYQPPTGYLEETSATDISTTKIVPGVQMCQRVTAWARGISVGPNSLSSILRSCP